VRAVGLAAGVRAIRAVKDEWFAVGVVEVDQPLVEHAAALALDHDLRCLDALHLAAALVLPADDLAFATWDRRLHDAAAAEGLTLIWVRLSWRGDVVAVLGRARARSCVSSAWGRCCEDT
jgi:predicted nucleic acid-binding protein